MSISERITAQIKEAMKARETLRTSVLRMLKAEILKFEADQPETKLDEAEFLKIIRRMVKMREEAATGFEAAGREEQAASERKEKAILEAYLPQALSEEELDALIKKAIAEVGASSMKEVGQVMKAALAAAEGRADGKRINERVRAKLSG